MLNFGSDERFLIVKDLGSFFPFQIASPNLHSVYNYDELFIVDGIPLFGGLEYAIIVSNREEFVFVDLQMEGAINSAVGSVVFHLIMVNIVDKIR